jgi:hypothetical protein
LAQEERTDAGFLPFCGYPGHDIRKVIFCAAGRMIDDVLAAAARPPLQAGDLVNQPLVME